jgi:solute carrier family 10 (sodium/bile acid cotransporter), member 7
MPERVTVPQTREEIAEVARAQGLTIPDACAEGVAANLALLARHAERLRESRTP